MRISIDTARCGAHGDCVLTAPELFDLDNDDQWARVLVEEPDESLHAAATDAAEGCPNQAITIKD